MKTEIKKLPKSQVELTITISAERAKNAYEEAFAKLKNRIDIPGFRAGKAPEGLIETKLGQPKIWEEAFKVLLPQAMIRIISEQKIYPLVDPQFQIEKLEKNQDLIFKATVPIRPEVKIGNYKKIKVKKEEPKVEIGEVDQIINKLFEKYKEDLKKSDRIVKPEETILTAKSVSEAVEKSKEKDILKAKEPDDLFAKKLGASSLNDLKKKIESQLLSTKKRISEQNFINAILDETHKIIEIDLPDILIERELNLMLRRLEARLKQTGSNLEKFLLEKKKRKEDLEKEWHPVAEKSAKIELALLKIAEEEKIEITDQDFKEEFKLVTDEKLRAELDKKEQKEYIKYQLKQRRVVEFLKEMAGG